MSSELIVQMVIAISSFCHNSAFSTQCTKQIWNCTHNIKDSRVMVTTMHNCMSDYLKELK